MFCACESACTALNSVDDEVLHRLYGLLVSKSESDFGMQTLFSNYAQHIGLKGDMFSIMRQLLTLTEDELLAKLESTEFTTFIRTLESKKLSSQLAGLLRTILQVIGLSRPESGSTVTVWSNELPFACNQVSLSHIC
jgi:hypothetical protein